MDGDTSIEELKEVKVEPEDTGTASLGVSKKGSQDRLTPAHLNPKVIANKTPEDVHTSNLIDDEIINACGGSANASFKISSGNAFQNHNTTFENMDLESMKNLPEDENIFISLYSDDEEGSGDLNKKLDVLIENSNNKNIVISTEPNKNQGDFCEGVENGIMRDTNEIGLETNKTTENLKNNLDAHMNTHKSDNKISGANDINEVKSVESTNKTVQKIEFKESCSFNEKNLKLTTNKILKDALLNELIEKRVNACEEPANKSNGINLGNVSGNEEKNDLCQEKTEKDGLYKNKTEKDDLYKEKTDKDALYIEKTEKDDLYKEKTEKNDLYKEKTEKDDLCNTNHPIQKNKENEDLYRQTIIKEEVDSTEIKLNNNNEKMLNSAVSLKSTNEIKVEEESVSREEEPNETHSRRKRRKPMKTFYKESSSDEENNYAMDLVKAYLGDSDEEYGPDFEKIEFKVPVKKKGGSKKIESDEEFVPDFENNSGVKRKKCNKGYKNVDGDPEAAENADCLGSSDDEEEKRLKRKRNRNKNGSTLCDICGKSFASRENLRLHRRSHTGYKPFKCDKCEKCFTRSDQLKEHDRIHTGEKPYICDVCGKGFSQRSPLKIHYRTHTGEKPFCCRFCNKGFTARGTMNVHAKKCTGPEST